ncbi:MAG: PEP-CTERM sorting domain-containing protein, partial [Crocosphaera sp.]|nr:PEP-CTERM sorting domain-containing protein [Crocosphaera sp.]
TEEPSVATTGNILTEQLIFHSSTGNAIAISQASGGWSHQSLRWEYTFGFEVEEIEYTLELSFEDEQQMAFVSGTLISPIEDTLTVSSANISQVPEPLTILGAGTALGFGTLFKRKLNASKKEKEQIS